MKISNLIALAETNENLNESGDQSQVCSISSNEISFDDFCKQVDDQEQLTKEYTFSVGRGFSTFFVIAKKA